MAKISTVHGEMEDSDLIKTEGGHENDNESATWVEYRLKSDPDGEPVHRSACVTLKQAVMSECVAQDIAG